LFTSKSQLNLFRRKLIKWFKSNGRDFSWRKTTSNYKKIVSEVLLQRTKAEAVEKYYSDFFDKYPDWETLSASSEEKIIEVIIPLGLWHRKSKSLLSLARVLAAQNGRFPEKRDEIENLPGIGQYITNAILLYCHNKREPLLDTNMSRVLERIFGKRKMADIRYDPYLQNLSRQVVDCDNSININYAILDFAAIVCKITKPSCQNCIFEKMCNYNIKKVGLVHEDIV
jgi:A/G-specific adenine glycosylase